MKKFLILICFTLCICSLVSCNKDSSQEGISLKGLPVKENADILPLEEQLFDASNAGNLEEVKKLIAQGVNINAKTNFGDTALLIAIKDNHLEMVKVLLQAGADVNLLTARGDMNNPYAEYQETPLMIASKNGNLEIVKELLAAGAKVNQILPINTERELMPGENQTALEMSCQRGNIEIVKTLAEAGASTRSILFCACKIGDEDLLKIALQKKPNLNFTTGEGGISPLIMAVENGYENIVKALLANGADVNYTDPLDKDYTALKAAEDNPNIVKLLKSYGAKE